MKQCNEKLRFEKAQLEEELGSKRFNGNLPQEINVNLHTTNVTCFNIGCSTVTNSHELKIEPQKFLQKATNQMPQYP
jgi:hypothetical protein